MSRSKETKTQKVLPGEEPVIHPKYNHKLIKVPAAARVQIHAASAPSVKDTLVLRSTEGKTKDKCTYWKERQVQNASRSDGFLNLSFSPGRNDGTAERARTDRRYTLAWRPGGKKKAEVILFEDRAYEETWKTGPDDDPDKIAALMAARFQETGGMILADRSPEVLDGLDTPEPIRESDEKVPDAGAPLPYDGPMPDPDTAKPMTARSGSSNESGGEGSNAEGASLPPGPRWLTLLRWEEGKPELMAIYEVTQSGTYKPATIEGEGPASTVGPAQADVLLPLDPHAETDVLARVSMVPPTRKRIEQQAARIRPTIEKRHDIHEDGPGHSFVPLKIGTVLELDRPSFEHTQLEAPSESEAEGPGGTVRLPNPLAAAERRLARAQAAHERFASWVETAKGAFELEGLVGGTCFREARGRTYLQNALKDGDAIDRIQWGNEFDALEQRAFSRSEDEMGALGTVPDRGDTFEHAPGEGGLLGQVLYGYQCQRAFLRFRRDRAVRAARAVMQSGPFEDLLYDTAVLSPSKDDGEVGPRIVEALARAAGLGDGASMTELLFEDGALAGDTAETALQPLLKGDTGVLEAAGPSEAPELKAILKLAQRTDGGIADLAVNAAPALLSVGVKRKLSTSVDAPAPLVLLGAFLTAGGAGGSISAQVGRAPEGHKTLRVQGGSTVTFERAPVEGLAHEGAPARRRWRVGWAEGLSGVAVAAGAGTPTDALELAIGGATVRARHESGALGPSSALTALTLAADTAESVSDRPALTRLATVLSHVDVAWKVAAALTDERQEGLQRVEDPSYLGALGEVAIAIGGAAAGGILGGGVLSVAAIGAASYAAGIPLGWLERWENADEHAASDPLIEWVEGKEIALDDYEGADDSRAALERHGGGEGRWGGWLAEESYWGNYFDGNPGAREALLDLVTAGKDESASPPPTDPIRRHAEQFTQTAFSFPTAVGVPPRPSVPDSNALSTSGPPKRLFLSIIPEYLPKKRGTFMIRARVIPEAPDLDEKLIEGALHYVKTSTALRYTVCRKGESLSLPSDTSLSDWADDECWPIGWKDDTPVPGGGVEEKVHFPVHVESGPRVTEWPVQELSKVHVETIDLELGLYRSQQAMKSLSAEEKARLSEAQRLERTVNPSSVLTVGGIEPILQSRGFRVEGYVYFNPLTPFQPAPSIPSGPPSQTDRILAGAEINYVHSE